MFLVFCCGESLNERETNNLFKIVEEQLESSLFQIAADKMKNVIIAYEPVWAIGTGKTATPEQAQEMHAFIRQLLKNKYSEEIASTTSILYGGSVNGSNASDLFKKDDIDGGLVGGASLKENEFIEIIKAMP
jgi:triosephosphate isomerase